MSFFAKSNIDVLFGILADFYLASPTQITWFVISILIYAIQFAGGVFGRSQMCQYIIFEVAVVVPVDAYAATTYVGITAIVGIEDGLSYLTPPTIQWPLCYRY